VRAGAAEGLLLVLDVVAAFGKIDARDFRHVLTSSWGPYRAAVLVVDLEAAAVIEERDGRFQLTALGYDLREWLPWLALELAGVGTC
jgi:hypothetical protein